MGLDTIKKVAILGPYGAGNLGDAAIVESMIQTIRRYHPNATIYGININPDDTLNRHNIASLPIHWWYKKSNVASDREPGDTGVPEKFKSTLKKIPILYALLKAFHKTMQGIMLFMKEVRFIVESYRNLKGFDLLIVNGSGQLCDLWGGPWLHPYGLFKWAVIAKARGVRFVVVSIGAGPIDFALSRYFIKYSLLLADYRSFRNESSKEMVEKIGVRGENRIFPDIAFGLPINITVRGDTGVGKSGRMIVGINPMAYYDPRCWPKSNENVYRNYIKKLASIGLWLCKRNYAVLWFSSAIMDNKVIEDIKKILEQELSSEAAHHFFHPQITTIDELLHQLSTMEVVVATRLHSLLLSSLLNKPLIAISPHPKVDFLMESLGQSEYKLDINTFDMDSFQDLFLLLESNRETVVRQIGEKITEYRGELDRQFDILFPKVPITA